MLPNTLQRRPMSLVALLVALLTALSIWQPTVAVASEPVVPHLVSLDLISSDVVEHGDEIVIGWEFDAPVDMVSVMLRDSMGGSQNLYGNAGAVTSGEVRGTIDTATWPGGTVTFNGFSYSWMSGDQYQTVSLDANGAVIWKTDGLPAVPPAGDAIHVAAFDVDSDVDLSIPPALLSAERQSAEVLTDGGEVVIPWEFDRPVDSVTLRLRDGLGRAHAAEWSAWGNGAGPSTTGVARVLVETPEWAAGTVVFSELMYTWGGGKSMTLSAQGAVIYKNPSGLADATLPAGGLGHLAFDVDSDFDPSVTPALTSLERTSADVVGDGDDVVLRWSFDAPVDSLTVTLRDALGGLHPQYSGMWGASTSGEIRMAVDTAVWPRGPVVLESINYAWGLGEHYKSVQMGADGAVIWSSGDVGEIPSAAEAIDVAEFEVDSELDLSIPPLLSSASRTSAGVLADGDELAVAWSFDRPVDQVRVRFRDAMGSPRYASWWGGMTPTTDGVARATIDTTEWAGGAVVFDGIEYRWGAASMILDASGAVEYKSPSGVEDATLPVADLAGLAFDIESDIDLAAVPALSSVTRVSGPALGEGELLQIGWEFDAPVDWVAFTYFDGLGRHQSLHWSGAPTTAGVASLPLDTSSWAPGTAELLQVRYSGAGDGSIVLSRDGTMSSKLPAGIDDAVPFPGGFAGLDFQVESDVVFQTVAIPEPVFVDATCDAPAHLKLDDFPHGRWSWSPNDGRSGDGADSHDGEPWSPRPGIPYTVEAYFDDGWGTTGQSRWTHLFVAPESCGPLLELTAAPKPIIDGVPAVGSELTVVPGTWAPEPVELSIQWMRDGVPIVGATTGVYALTVDDADASITVEVTGSKAGYETAVRSSDPVDVQPPVPSPVERLSGPDRFATSAVISAESYEPGVDVVFVANGLNFPDALAGAPVAGAEGGPLLLVADSMIPAVVAAELDRLDPKRIVVLGGAGVVHESVVQALEAYID